MIVSEKALLHEAIENLSTEEISIVLRMIKGLLNISQIEELPQNEVPRQLKILAEMNSGHFIKLDDLKL